MRRFLLVSLFVVSFIHCRNAQTATLLSTEECEAEGALPFNFKEVPGEHGLFRSGLLDSETQLQCLKQKYGITHIVSLMGAVPGDKKKIAWEQELAEKNGITFQQIELPLFKVTPRSTITVLKEKLNFIAKREDVRALIHCYHGQDRTGTAVALHKVWQKLATPDEAKAEYEGQWTREYRGLSKTIDRELFGDSSN